MERHRIVLAVCLLVSVSGCLGQDLEGAGTQEGAVAWEQHLSFSPTFPNAAEGRPFMQFSHLLGGLCDVGVTLWLPEGTTAIETHLHGDPKPPGSGFLVHRVWDGAQPHAPGPVRYVEGETIYEGPPDTDHWVNVTDPTPVVKILVYPHGAVADQQWSLDIRVQGHGNNSAVEVEGLGGFELC